MKSNIYKLNGEPLSSINFVMDYLEFHFADLMLTVYTNPVVTTKGIRVKMGEPGWRDAFCSLITLVVDEVLLDEGETQLTIKFCGSSELSVRLGFKDKTEVETALFSGRDFPLEVWPMY